MPGVFTPLRVPLNPRGSQRPVAAAGRLSKERRALALGVRFGDRGAWARGHAGISLAAALVAAFGCGNRAGTEADAGTLSSGGDGAPRLELGDAATPCDRYFAAMYGLAQASQYGSGPALPAAEVVRTRARFERSCQDQLALPGSGVTEAKLLACISARESWVDAWASPRECDFKGSLAGGAPCVDKVQCQSGRCATGTENPIVQGYTCGTCQVAQSLGEACNRAPTCTEGNGCFALTPDAAYPDFTCLPITEAKTGEHCDDLSTICASGLYCDRDASTCSLPAKLGEACAPQRPCAPPLICWGSPAVCRSRSSACAACGEDCNCTLNLGCSSGRCAVTWVPPGGTCDGERRLCLVGDCAFSRYQNVIPPPPPLDGGVLLGTCPRVIPDGQPCDGNDALVTCDTFSLCFQGRCALTDGVVCQ